MNALPEIAGLRVTVGMLTYRRPDRLALGLPEVVLQAEALQTATGRRVEVVVVDNDPGETARDYVSGLADEHPVVRYVAEPTPGIAAARQRCLKEAEGADLIQFVDDDEIPEADWLKNMVATWASQGRPTAVAGCVRPRYLHPPSEFVAAGGFFVRREYPTGTELRAGAPTSNLLIDLGELRRLGLHFETALGLRGGEDTLLTRQIVAAGGRIVFCADAIVYDLVPADRNQRTWVLRRAWHHGSTHSLVSLWEARQPARRAVLRVELVVGGSLRAVAGWVKAAGGRLTGSVEREAKGLRMHWRGRGIVRGALRATPPEYKR
jgi:succinoglycan biosynthesis protein ExoM